MKLSEYKGEDALDILADLIEPAAEIMTDPEIISAFRGDVPKTKIARLIIKGHKSAIISVLAALERENPEEYAKKMNLFTLPAKLVELFNDPELINLFTLQGQETEGTSSGSATESIEG